MKIKMCVTKQYSYTISDLSLYDLNLLITALESSADNLKSARKEEIISTLKCAGRY